MDRSPKNNGLTFTTSPPTLILEYPTNKFPMLGAVLSHETIVRIYNVDGSEYTSLEDEEMTSNSLTMIMILAVVIPVFVIDVTFGLYCYIKRRRDFSLKTRSKYLCA